MNRWLWALSCSLILHLCLFLPPLPSIKTPELHKNIRVQLLSYSGSEKAGSTVKTKSLKKDRDAGTEAVKSTSHQTEGKTSEPQAKAIKKTKKIAKKSKPEIKNSEIVPEKTKVKIPDQKKNINKKVKEKKTTPSKNSPSTAVNQTQLNTAKQRSTHKTEKTGSRGDSSGKSSVKTISTEKSYHSGKKIISETDVQIKSQIKPSYPRISRKRKEEGTVTVLLEVKSGRVKSMTIETSSGHDRLDRSAIKALKRWKFDRAVTATVRVPVIFSLKK